MDPTPTPPAPLNMGLIIGASVGGAAVVLILIFLVYRCRRKKENERQNQNHTKAGHKSGQSNAGFEEVDETKSKGQRSEVNNIGKPAHSKGEHGQPEDKVRSTKTKQANSLPMSNGFVTDSKQKNSRPVENGPESNNNLPDKGTTKKDNVNDPGPSATTASLVVSPTVKDDAPTVAKCTIQDADTGELTYRVKKANQNPADCDKSANLAETEDTTQVMGEKSTSRVNGVKSNSTDDDENISAQKEAESQPKEEVTEKQEEIKDTKEEVHDIKSKPIIDNVSDVEVRERQPKELEGGNKANKETKICVPNDDGLYLCSIDEGGQICICKTKTISMEQTSADEQKALARKMVEETQRKKLEAKEQTPKPDLPANTPTFPDEAQESLASTTLQPEGDGLKSSLDKNSKKQENAATNEEKAKVEVLHKTTLEATEQTPKPVLPADTPTSSAETHKEKENTAKDVEKVQDTGMLEELQEKSPEAKDQVPKPMPSANIPQPPTTAPVSTIVHADSKEQENMARDEEKAKAKAMLEELQRKKLEEIKPVSKPSPPANTPKPPAEANKSPASTNARPPSDIIKYTPPQKKVNERWPPQRVSLGQNEGAARFNMEVELQRRLKSPDGVGLRSSPGVNRHKGPVKRKSYGGAQN